jgi:hypothetical protein
MKFSQRATLSILTIAVLTSTATIGLAGLQLRPQRAAVGVVIDTAIVAELTGVSDAIRDMPPNFVRVCSPVTTWALNRR